MRVRPRFHCLTFKKMAQLVLPIFAVGLYGNGQVSPSCICHSLLQKCVNGSFPNSLFAFTEKKQVGTLAFAVQKQASLKAQFPFVGGLICFSFINPS